MTLFPLGFPDSSVGQESTCNAGDPSLIPGSGRSTGEEIGYYSIILGLPFWLRWQKICLQCRRPGFNSWVGKIPWGRERLPTQYYGLGNSMDCIVHGVSKSQTRLNTLHFHFQLFTSGGQSIGA